MEKLLDVDISTGIPITISMYSDPDSSIFTIKSNVAFFGSPVLGVLGGEDESHNIGPGLKMKKRVILICQISGEKVGSWYVETGAESSSS